MADLRMAEINNVLLAGNLTRDPVYKTTQSGNALVTFTVATNKRFRDKNNKWQEDVCFVSVVARSRLAESCNKWLKRGSAVLVEGELQNRVHTNDKGFSFRVIELKARRIQFLDKVPPQNKRQKRDPKTAEHSTTDQDAISKEALDQKEKPTNHEHEGPITFEDDQYNDFISSEESELLRKDSSNT